MRGGGSVTVVLPATVREHAQQLEFPVPQVEGSAERVDAGSKPRRARDRDFHPDMTSTPRLLIQSGIARGGPYGHD